MRVAAPAVKPSTTVCETKFTTRPMRSAPMASMIAPARNDSVSTRLTYSPDPGTASGATVANTNSETALVGPETACQDEPNSAATMAGTMAQYRPYSGGMPASVAKATPCGITTTAPIRPAVASARSVPRLTRGHQSRKGRKRRRAAGEGSLAMRFSGAPNLS